MPLSKKFKYNTASSKSSILKYFTSDLEAQNNTFSSSNENQHNDIGSKYKSSSKRQAESCIPHETPKKCKLLNLEPIVISSSDEGEFDVLVPKSVNRVPSLIKSNAGISPKHLDNLEHRITPSLQCDLVRHQGTETENEKIQAAPCLLKRPTSPNMSLKSVKPIGADNTDLEEESIENEDDAKVAYYHLNFCRVLGAVLDNKDDRALFEKSDDMIWIDKFQNLPLPAQKLYVRLYHRKVAWLREEQVSIDRGC